MSDDTKGPAFAGYWRQASPNSMVPTIHIGELTISEGRQWQIGRDWGGASLVVSTDLPHEGEDARGRTKTFILSGGPLVKALARGLLDPPTVPDALDAGNVFEVLADGLEASIDGRGWDATHDRARILATNAPAMLAMLERNLSAWEDEEESVKEEHAELIADLKALLEVIEHPRLC